VAIPDYQTLMLPLLKAVSDNEVHTIRSLYDRLSDEFELTPEERVSKLPSGRVTHITNRISWARTYLRKAGLLVSPTRGMVQITIRGLDVLKDNPSRIDNTFLKQFDEFVEFSSGNKVKAKTEQLTLESADNKTPEETLEMAYRELQDELATNLLDVIKNMSPEFFEQLVVDLMLAMGYGGNREAAGRATKYTADGGIDGVINEDRLGLDTIYLQAKRYTENTVGRPAIQQFAGALDMQRAKKGVFITTSQFSREATEFVALIEKQIVLIDGAKLANLMVEYGLGVTTKQTYAIKQIDSDYFSED